MRTGSFWSRPKIRRWTEITFTTAFWFAWFYLILPLISLVLWLVGYRLFVEELLVDGGFTALMHELRNYGLVVLGMSVVMVLWIRWNLYHYGQDNNKRIHQPPSISAQEQAGAAGLSLEELRMLQSSRNSTVDFDEQDRLFLVQD